MTTTTTTTMNNELFDILISRDVERGLSHAIVRLASAVANFMMSDDTDAFELRDAMTSVRCHDEALAEQLNHHFENAWASAHCGDRVATCMVFITAIHEIY